MRETSKSCYPAGFNLEVLRPMVSSRRRAVTVILLIVLSRLIMFGDETKTPAIAPELALPTRFMRWASSSTLT